MLEFCCDVIQTWLNTPRGISNGFIEFITYRVHTLLSSFYSQQLTHTPHSWSVTGKWGETVSNFYICANCWQTSCIHDAIRRLSHTLLARDITACEWILPLSVNIRFASPLYGQRLRDFTQQLRFIFSRIQARGIGRALKYRKSP